MHRFYGYRGWRRKPFMFAEWAVWGAEDPGFVRRFFAFLRGHRRVRLAVYYQSASLRREFRLSAHPARGRPCAQQCGGGASTAWRPSSAPPPPARRSAPPLWTAGGGTAPTRWRFGPEFLADSAHLVKRKA